MTYVVLVALASLLPGLILVFVTRNRWPRVASGAMTLLGISLGVIGLLATIQQLQQGMFEGVSASRYFKATVARDESPVHFWFLASFFGIPSLLLVGGGLISIAQSFFKLARPLARRAKTRNEL